MGKLKKGKLINILLLIGIIIAIIYMIINSNLFDSKDIQIEGCNKITKEYVIKNLKIKQDKNIFMYNINEMEQLLKKNKYVQDVKIKRKIPNKLHVLIIEKDINVVVKNNNTYCYVDNKLDFIDKLNNEEDVKNYIIADIDYVLEKDESITYKSEKNKKILESVTQAIKNNNLYNNITNINIKKDMVVLYNKDNIEIILPNDKGLSYNIKVTASILTDLKSKRAKGGVVDFSHSKNPIYKVDNK